MKTLKSGSKINKNNVKFTKKEIDEFQKLVRKSNYKRDVIRGEFEKMQGPTYLKYSKPIIIAPKKASASLNQFTSKKDFKKEMSYLRKATNKNFVQNRVRLMKRNLIKAVIEVYGDDGEKMANQIKSMTQDQFKKMVAENSDDIGIFMKYLSIPDELMEQLDEFDVDMFSEMINDYAKRPKK